MLSRVAIIAQLLLHAAQRGVSDAAEPVTFWSPNEPVTALLKRQGHARPATRTEWMQERRRPPVQRWDLMATTEAGMAAGAAEPDDLGEAFNALTEQQRYELSLLAVARPGRLRGRRAPFRRMARRVAMSLDMLGLVKFHDKRRDHYCTLTDLGRRAVDAASRRDIKRPRPIMRDALARLERAKERGLRIAAGSSNKAVRAAAHRLVLAVHFRHVLAAEAAGNDVQRAAQRAQEVTHA